MKKYDNLAIFEPVEPRILFSADGLAGADVNLAEPIEEVPAIEAEFNTAQTDSSSETSQENDSLAVRNEIVFIDENVEGYEQLVDDLLENGEGRNFEIRIIQDNGLEEITSALEGAEDVSAIHIIAHGDEGQIQIGDTTITNDTFNEFHQTLSGWSAALTEEADILFYGCNVAGSEDGQQLLGKIADSTGADIAASDDLTGNVDEGGDWVLEYHHGQLETELALSQQAQDQFQGVLDIDTGLVAHWDFDSNANDASGNNNNGTLVNGAAIDPTDATDKIGDAKLSLDGFNDYVDLSANTSSFSGLSEGTISAWINTTDTGLQSIFSISDTADMSSFATLGLDNGQLFFRVDENGTRLFDVDASPMLNDGNWHHVAVTVSSTGNKLFVDGVEITGSSLNYLAGDASSTEFFDDVNSLDATHIGVREDSLGFLWVFDGLIDDSRVYDRALTSSDINELYNHPHNAPVNTVPGSQSVNEDTLLNITGISVNDADGNLATTQLTVNNGDLNVNLAGGATISAGANGSNTLTLSGSQTQINAALATLNYQGNPNFNGSDTLTVVSTDSDGTPLSDTDNVSITVNAVNDATVVSSIEGSNISYTENDGAVTITSTLSLNDIDDTNLELAVIQITGNYVNGEDVLSFTNQNGISGSWNASTGTLTLSGTSSVANYQAALRSIAYTNNSEDPSTATRTVSFTVNDGDDDSNTQTRNISVAAVEQAPSDISSSSTTDGGLSINADGGNDVYLQADDGGAIVGGLGTVTIETSFSFDSAPSGSIALLSYAEGANDEALGLFIYSTGQVLFTADSTGTAQISASTYTQLFDGNRHHLAASWDNSNGAVNFYVDGQLVESFTGYQTAQTIGTGGTLVIGNDQDSVGGSFDPVQAFSGTLYDVRIFDDVRTTNEINQHYNSDLPYNESNLVANWQFNSFATDQNGTQTIVETVSGNSLTVNHASGAGFVSSDPSLTFVVNENAIDGTVVGSISGIDEERNAQIEALLAADSDLVYSAETNKFYKTSTSTANFTTAQTDASSTSLNSVNGQLVTIRSAVEQEIVANIASGVGSNLWIGASDATVEGEWRWLDSSGDTDQFWEGDENGYATNNAYTNWLSGKPDSGSGDEDGILIRASDGLWDDYLGSLSRGYIIEWSADDVLDQTQALTYSIQSQTVSGAFAVNSDTGEITVADGSLLDFESNKHDYKYLI